MYVVYRQIFDHLRSGMVCNFGCVRMYVCIHVSMSGDNFRKP